MLKTLHYKLISSLLVGVLVAGIGASAIMTLGQGYADDGRLNVTFHMGGAAVYCVGRSSTGSGGIRVLSADGTELFFATAEAILAVGIPSEWSLVAATIDNGGWELYRSVTGQFSLQGFDEHGKPFDFRFDNCTPQGVPPNAGSGDDDDDDGGGDFPFITGIPPQEIPDNLP